MFGLIIFTLVFLFGTSIGSFVQVVATRLNVAPIISSRSKCLSCGEALRVYDLIPIVSHLLVKGKCRYCKASFGVSSLLVEIVYGFTFVALYHFILSGQISWLAMFLWFIYYTILFITLGVIALYDKAHTYIPTYFLVIFIGLTMLIMVNKYISNYDVLNMVAPFAVALPFFVIWLISKGKALGFGDVVLFFGVGAFFGLAQGFAVFLLSIWSGALVGVFIYLSTDKNKRKNIAIPFVPFIVFAFIIVLFTDIDIFSIASLFA